MHVYNQIYNITHISYTTTFNSSASSQRIPLNSILHRAFPPRPPQKHPLNQRNQPQRNCNTSPKTIKPPIQAKRRAETNRHRHGIIAKQLHPAAKGLSTQATEEAVAVCGEGVEELESGAEGEDGCDEVDDLFVGAEEAGEVGAEGG